MSNRVSNAVVSSEQEAITHQEMVSDLLALKPGDISALHDIMRILLAAAAEEENTEKRACAELWNLCNKEDTSPNSADAFEALNSSRAYRRHYTNLRRRYERMTAFIKKLSKHQHRLNAYAER